MSNGTEYRHSIQIKAQMLELIKEYDRNPTITVTAFCKQHQINKASFYNARSHYGKEELSKPKPSGFISLGSPASKESAPCLKLCVQSLHGQ